MIVIEGLPLILTYTNVLENDAPEWSALTAYAVNATVMVAAVHKLYLCLVPHNNAYPPDNCAGATDKWMLVGATNKYMDQDPYVGTATTRPFNLVKEYDASGRDAVSLFNVSGKDLLLELVKDGQVIWSTQRSCIRPVYTYKDWYFAQRVFVRHFAVRIPLKVNVTLRITVTGGGLCGLGNVVLGLHEVLGGTQWGMDVQLLTYSRVDTNSFGYTYISPGKKARKLTNIVEVDNDLISHVLNRLDALDATPCAWILNNANGWEPECTLLYGILRSPGINIPGPLRSTLRVEILGMI